MFEPRVRFDALGQGSKGSCVFVECSAQVQADSPTLVVGVLDEVERWVNEGGHAAGFVTYEAAPGLEPASVVQPKTGPMPLVWFGLFRHRIEVDPLMDLDAGGEYDLAPLVPSLDFARYEHLIKEVQDYIAAGDSYQVNLTQRLRGSLTGDPRQLYADMCRNQGGAHCALVELENFAVLSASPELFFAVHDGELQMRPMKGTCRRGRWPEEDEQMAGALRASAKDRAENVMIVDLIRNDMGRVSQLGSVTVDELWALERYETVWQMTSQVRSRCRPELSLSELFAALFPSGSVTGAPKVRTMEIIAELEDSPRGIYTGAIGYVSPRDAHSRGTASTVGVAGLEASFNVAIRTLVVDRHAQRAEAGVGGGITHYSSALNEHEESLLKARFLTERRRKFTLLETLLCTEDGYFLLDKHLRRLRASAGYFGFHCPLAAIAAELLTLQSNLSFPGHHRVRLTLSIGGEVTVESRPLESSAELAPWPVAICQHTVDSDDVFLYHKTTNRFVYEERLGEYPDCRDIILCNEEGELTECCVGNLVLEVDGRYVTPLRSSGLLAGTFREQLLEAGLLHERVLYVADAQQAQRAFLINSVRKWVELTLIAAGGEKPGP